MRHTFQHTFYNGNGDQFVCHIQFDPQFLTAAASRAIKSRKRQASACNGAVKLSVISETKQQS